MSGRGREAGSTAGAVFLQQFVGDTPWAHLDIAAMAWSSRDLPLSGKGATGFGVRLLDRLVADQVRSDRLTEVGFYHLTRSTLEEALPRLLEKAYAAGNRVLVRVRRSRAAGAAEPGLVDLRQGLLPAARHARATASPRSSRSISRRRSRIRTAPPSWHWSPAPARPTSPRSTAASTCSTAAIARLSTGPPALARGPGAGPRLRLLAAERARRLGQGRERPDAGWARRPPIAPRRRYKARGFSNTPSPGCRPWPSSAPSRSSSPTRPAAT